MAFDIDPDRPDVPALARILSAMGLLCLVGAVVSMILAVMHFVWVNDTYAMLSAGGAFVLALIFIGQAKTIELLAIVSARVRSRFALEAAIKTQQAQHAAAAPALEAEKRQAPITPSVKEPQVIHVPDEQAREQGFKVR